MSGALFRLFVDDSQTDRETLDRVERITVEQQIDMIWEALVELPVCTDERGEWSSEDEEYTAAFSRLPHRRLMAGSMVVISITTRSTLHFSARSTSPFTVRQKDAISAPWASERAFEGA